jgi:hypothetical protein
MIFVPYYKDSYHRIEGKLILFYCAFVFAFVPLGSCKASLTYFFKAFIEHYFLWQTRKCFFVDIRFICVYHCSSVLASCLSTVYYGQYNLSFLFASIIKSSARMYCPYDVSLLLNIYLEIRRNLLWKLFLCA